MTYDELVADYLANKPSIAPAITDLKGKVSRAKSEVFNEYDKDIAGDQLDTALKADKAGQYDDAVKTWLKAEQGYSGRFAHAIGIDKEDLRAEPIGSERLEKALKSGGKVLASERSIDTLLSEMSDEDKARLRTRL